MLLLLFIRLRTNQRESPWPNGDLIHIGEYNLFFILRRQIGSKTTKLTNSILLHSVFVYISQHYFLTLQQIVYCIVLFFLIWPEWCQIKTPSMIEKV